MMNVTTDMDWFKIILQNVDFQGQNWIVIFAENFVQKDSCAREMKHWNNIFKFLDIPRHKFLCSIFYFRIGVSVFEWQRVEHN